MRNMSHNVTSFSDPGLDVYFQSAGAKVDGKATNHLNRVNLLSPNSTPFPDYNNS